MGNPFYKIGARRETASTREAGAGVEERQRGGRLGSRLWGVLSRVVFASLRTRLVIYTSSE